MPYNFDDEMIDEIREKNDIVDVISEYVDLTRTGSNYKGICPFHNEKTPSFMVSPNKQIFHCFGCGEGGNVITFIMKHLNMDFVDTLNLLASRVNIDIETKKTKRNKELEDRNKLLFNINKDSAKYFYENLQNNKKALSYIRERGIDESVIKSYGLGYALPDWSGLLEYLLHKGYKIKDIHSLGLIIQRKDKSGYFDRFRDRIIFPIINNRGSVVGFGGRIIEKNGQPKYLNSPDSPIFNKGYNLYGINIVKKYARGKDVILVEGYMDVISLYKYGIRSSVASLGTSLTENQVKLIKRYGKDVYLCYDSDEAGKKATNRALEILKKEDVEAKVIVLKDAKDPDEFINKFGLEKFYETMSNAFPYMDFKIQLYKEKHDLNISEGRIAFIKEIVTELKKIKSPVERDVYLDKISKETKVSKDSIKEELKYLPIRNYKDKYINKNNRDNNKDRIKPVINRLEPGYTIAEKKLLYLICKDKNIYESVKTQISPEDFITEEYKKIAERLYEYYENEEFLFKTFEKVLNDNLIGTLENIYNTQINIDASQKNKVLEDFIKTVKIKKLENKKVALKERLKEIDLMDSKSEGDVEKFKSICLQLINIDKELKLHQ